MITIVLLLIVAFYVGIHMWAAIMPYLYGRALMRNKEVIKSIEDMWASYDKMQDNIDDYCKKYPEACKKAEEDRRQMKKMLK